MEVVENLPKSVVQPYQSMTVQQLIECDDVPPEDLVGAESIHKHLKIYKSLFKTFVTDNKDILERFRQMEYSPHRQSRGLAHIV